MLSELTTKDRTTLRERVLRYFSGPYGKRVEGIADQPEFKNYTKSSVMRMIHALRATGDLELIGGSTRDAAYRTSKPK